MALALGDLAHPVGEVEPLAEVVEGEGLFQVVLVDDAPAAAELLLQRAQLRPPERRNTAPARYAVLAGQFGHLGAARDPL